MDEQHQWNAFPLIPPIPVKKKPLATPANDLKQKCWKNKICSSSLLLSTETTSLPKQSHKLRNESNTKLNTHSQTKECDFDLQDKKQHDQKSVLQLMWTIHRDIFSQHTCFSCSKWELFLKNTSKIHKKQNLLWAFHRIYRGCLGSWCNFMLSHSIWIRTYLLSSDIQFRGIWTGECTKAF